MYPLLLLVVFWAWFAVGQEVEHLAERNPDWPQAWFEPARTASEMGITEFAQSPYLTRHFDTGSLPPLRDRLPADPLVSVPLEQIGRYGGTARITTFDNRTFFNVEPTVTISADHKTILPNLAESWVYTDDGHTLTMTLREGLRWSDGHPFTTADFVFALNDLVRNTDYMPVPPKSIQGVTIEALDERTMRYRFEAPHPLFVHILAQFPEALLAPKHYFSQFHPTYVGEDRLDELMQEMGFINWTSFFNANRADRIEESADAPTMRAYRLMKRTPTLARYERNPYYFKVDPTGQQLPYIDRVDAEVIAEGVVVVAKASTGQLDFAGYSMPTQDIPLLKLGERTGAISVHVWRRLHGSDLVLQPNYNHKDERLRALFYERTFREALSIAIDRDEMNQIIYFGRGVPRQVTVIPSSSYYEPEFASAFTQHDPAGAGVRLDALGLIDRDGDGLREYADGSPLVITVEFIDFETPKQISMELIASYWRAVGIDLRLKLVDRGLQWERARTGDMQMTVWHADRTTDILFPLQPDWWVPRTIAWSMSMWNDWTRWYLTDGRLGEEPPDEIRKLQAWADGLRTSVDPDERIAYGKQILRSNAENLWSIGTVGLAPHPVVVSARLKNVPTNGIWGWDTRWTLPYHPATWFFAESAAVEAAR